MRGQMLQALVMQVRGYRETSALVQFFTREQGRMAGVMRGLHRGRRPVTLQPFRMGMLSVSGRGNLVNVNTFDDVVRFDLPGNALSAGFYVLELVKRALDERQVEARVFDASIRTLTALSVGEPLAPCLRDFESRLLSELGYGVDYASAGDAHEAVQADAYYQYLAQQGLQRIVADHLTSEASAVLPGWALQAMSRGDFSDRRVGRYAQQLHQQALLPLIGTAPLVSRSLYQRRSPEPIRGAL